ncbi:hypothetical protein S2091_4715 [Solimicrobium silvestre]|uniref:Uncharacterized protein n=1 Tax=Solimicrobium silvestre TaxID=2099400 RepID=A0A2S9GS87_9BURK|nr:hypothetical protein S2091_4715 [Solimicrobium silvestre]
MTVLPDTVQTDVVAEVNATAKLVLLVADTVKGAVPYDLPVNAANVMVCVPLVTVNDSATWGAAL